MTTVYSTTSCYFYFFNVINFFTRKSHTLRMDKVPRIGVLDRRQCTHLEWCFEECKHVFYSFLKDVTDNTSCIKSTLNSHFLVCTIMAIKLIFLHHIDMFFVCCFFFFSVRLYGKGCNISWNWIICRKQFHQIPF